MTQPADRNELALIGLKEVKLEFDLLGEKHLPESQLVNSQRKLEALGHLSQSLVRNRLNKTSNTDQRWFIDSLLDLQSAADEIQAPGGHSSELLVSAIHGI